MLNDILDFILTIVMVLLIGAGIGIYLFIQDKMNVTVDDNNTSNFKFPEHVGFNVLQRSNTGSWVNRGTNLSENSAWHLAEKLQEEGRPIQIKDTKGNLIASL